jgi:hypothetical protein
VEKVTAKKIGVTSRKVLALEEKTPWFPGID